MSAPGIPTLEVLWQEDASAHVFVRSGDGTLSAGDLRLGEAEIVDLPLAGAEVAVRTIDVRELIALTADPPPGLELGGSA
ncbi:MAG: hypothetical protein QOE91_230, partial [Gaiellaceae bacterium]|nr:hypothetical protein [Gaiellaceae bacterium]